MAQAGRATLENCPPVRSSIVSIGALWLLLIGGLFYQTTPPPLPTPTTQYPTPTGLPAKVINIGETVQGFLTIPGAADRYAFFGKYGDTVTIGVFTQPGQDFTPALTLYAPDGSALVDQTSPGQVLASSVQLPNSGAYILLLRAGRQNAIGGYTLSLGAGAQLRELDGEALRFNRPARGTLLRAGDRQVWTFEARAGMAFTVLAQPAGESRIDPVITIITPGGEKLLEAHDLSPLNSAQTPTITVPVAGTYQIQITDYTNSAIGDYDLILQQVIAPTAAPAASVTFAPISVQAQGSVAQGSRYTNFFNGVQGQTVVVTVRAVGSFDPIVEIVGPSGRRVALADDDAGVTDVSLRVTLDDGNGVYTVKVFGYALLPGEFTLTIQSPP
jgi:hypothetical protein